jgi:protein-S-isoprenylcysteine O-methyltransferase Ste14/predicted DCC family thiol-disulfide oxidoreductase YuxK
MRSFIHGSEGRAARGAWGIARTLGVTLLTWALFLLVLPALIYALEGSFGPERYRFASPAGRVIGVALFALGGALGLTSAAVLAVKGRGTVLPTDCPRELVVAGPYRYVRNPVGIAGLMQGAGAGVFLGSPLVLAYTLVGVLLWDAVVRPWEEDGLERRFGEAYRRYRRRVRCWRPRWRGYDPAREAEEPPVAPEHTTPPGVHVVLYDGRCRFCTKQSRNLVRLARPGALEARDFQAPGVLDRFPGLSHEACMRAMHLVCPDGRVFAGFEAAVRAVATRPVVGRVAYLYYVPGLRLALDVLYGLVARYRYLLLGKAVAAGACEGGTCSLHFGKR